MHQTLTLLPRQKHTISLSVIKCCMRRGYDDKHWSMPARDSYIVNNLYIISHLLTCRRSDIIYRIMNVRIHEKRLETRGFAHEAETKQDATQKTLHALFLASNALRAKHDECKNLLARNVPRITGALDQMSGERDNRNSLQGSRSGRD